MARPPSIQWYYKQYLGDNKVLAMDWDARGMHHWLLNLSAQEEPPGSLPNDMAVIRRWLSSPSEDIWRRVQPQIFTAWALRGNRWFNSGMVETFKRKENYQSGRKVRNRYETGTKNDEDLAKTEVIKESSFEVDVKHAIQEFSESYISDVYKAYPRKVGRAGAYKAIGKALKRLCDGEDSPGDLFSSIGDATIYLVQRAKLFADSPAGKAGEFTPYPATWFNDKRYLDDESEWWKRGESDNPTTEKCPRCEGPKWLPSLLSPGKVRECDCAAY